MSVEDQKEDTLAGIAKKIHEAIGGDLSQSTTGVGRLKDGTLVMVSQLGKSDKVKAAAAKFGIKPENVLESMDAGYHCEVTMYIAYRANLETVGASQDYCPLCWKFVQAKGIKTSGGGQRKTPPQVWRSPEYYDGQEITKGATYPWLLVKIQPENERKTFNTKAEYDAWFKQRT